MSPRKRAREVVEMLGTLSLDERVTALVVSIITRDPEAVGAIVRLFACGIGDGRPIVS